jgi:hypothetical protein
VLLRVRRRRRRRRLRRRRGPVSLSERFAAMRAAALMALKDR